MSEQDFSLRLRNSRKSRLNVYLEPWGEAYVLAPSKDMQVVARGPAGEAPNNMLEIESNENGIVLWGWSGSNLTVRNP
jgi:hypothetical protein